MNITFHGAARTTTINALSAHVDRSEMLEYFSAMGKKVKKAFVVHGEQEQALSFAGALREKIAARVEVPEPGQTFTI